MSLPGTIKIKRSWREDQWYEPAKKSRYTPTAKLKYTTTKYQRFPWTTHIIGCGTSLNWFRTTILQFRTAQIRGPPIKLSSGLPSIEPVTSSSVYDPNMWIKIVAEELFGCCLPEEPFEFCSLQKSVVVWEPLNGVNAKREEVLYI